MAIGDELWAAVRVYDAEQVDALLSSALGSELEELRAWHVRERAPIHRWLRAERRQLHRPWDRARVPESLLLLWLAPPGIAAEWVGWDWDGIHGEWWPAATRAMESRGDLWMEGFVAGLVKHGHGPYNLVRSTCDRLGLPHPTDERSLGGWLNRGAVTRPTYPSHSGDEDAAAARTAESLRADGRTAELWAAALGHNDLGRYPSFGQALRLLTEEGELDRLAVIDAVATTLTTPGKPYAQRVLVRLLEELAMRPEEVPGGLPMAQGLVATLHGSASGPLLSAATSLLSSSEDLVELATTITGRPEKNQRRQLLKFLLAPEATERLGAQGVRASLELFAGLDDAAVATQAQERLGRDVPTERAGAHGLWELSVEVQPPQVSHFGDGFSFGEPHEAVVRRAMADPGPFHGGSTALWLVPTALEVLVRWAHEAGVEPVRRALRDAPLASSGPGVFGLLVSAWVAGEPVDSRLAARYNGAIATDLLAVRHLAECLHRLGEAPFLLSTPCTSHGSLGFDHLVDRLRRCPSFGPLDLALALMRVSQVEPARAGELDGAAVVPPSLAAGVQSTTIADACSYVRTTVAGRGLRVPVLTTAELDQQGWLVESGPPLGAFWQTMLPIDLADFDVTLGQLSAPGSGSGSGSTSFQIRGVAPHAVDLRLRSDAELFAESPPPWFAHWGMDTDPLQGPGLPGVVSHLALLTRYAATQPYLREEAVTLTLGLIGTRRYLQGAAVTAAVVLHRRGRLNLARCAAAWEQMFLAGGMSAVWPVALEVAAAVSASPGRKPPGLADLYRFLSAYAGEVPDLSLPDGVRALAEEKGSTKSHAEVRRLVEVASR